MDQCLQEPCRVCLAQYPTEVLVPLVQNNQLTDYATAVLTFASVKINPNDGLPDKMCPKCVKILKQAIIFKLMCENSHKQLVYSKLQTRSKPARERRKTDYPDETSYDNYESDFFCHNYDSNPSETGKITEDEKPENITEDIPKECQLPDGRMKCDKCGQIVSCRSSLRNHMNRKHNDSCRFMCELCGRGFKEKSDLQRHLSIAHGHPKKYACKLCDYTTTTRVCMKTHLNRHLGNRQYKCDACDKSFFSQQTWRQHQAYHSGKRFKCDQCPREFYRRSDLASHRDSCHERKYLYRCSFPECQTAFKKVETVRRHLVRSHGVPRARQGAVSRVSVADVSMARDCARLRPNAVVFNTPLD